MFARSRSYVAISSMLVISPAFHQRGRASTTPLVIPLHVAFQNSKKSFFDLDSIASNPSWEIAYPVFHFPSQGVLDMMMNPLSSRSFARSTKSAFWQRSTFSST